jgi:hypothetical protein
MKAKHELGIGKADCSEVIRLSLCLFVSLAMAVGWILNVISLFNMAMTDSPVTTMFVLKIIGIFIFPLGSILGWFYS